MNTRTAIILGLVVAAILGLGAVLVLVLKPKRRTEKYQGGDMNLLDLAEFDGLDPEIKDMYDDFTRKVMPIAIDDLNKQWRKKSQSDRDTFRQIMALFGDEAVLEYKKRSVVLKRMAERAVMTMAPTLAPMLQKK